jgi:hypothetical protein
MYTAQYSLFLNLVPNLNKCILHNYERKDCLLKVLFDWIPQHFANKFRLCTKPNLKTKIR